MTWLPWQSDELQEARHKAEHILADAREQAHALRMNAQLEADKILHDRAVSDEAFRAAQVQQIEAMTAQAKELITKQTQVIAQLCEDMTSDFKKQTLNTEKILFDQAASMGKSLVAADERMKQAFEQVSTQAEGAYTALVDEVKKRMARELEQEILASRQAVTAYKEEWFKLLDAQIVRLVEDTARIALNKTLTLDDHRGIILAALAEAKLQGVFGTPTTP